MFILESLLRDGRIEKTTLDEYRSRYREEVQSLEARIARLRDLAGPILPAAVDAAAEVTSAVARATRRAAKRAAKKVKAVLAKDTPERTKTRELQGRYLGLSRQIPKTVMKKRFGKQAIAAKGKEAVIAEMQAFIATSARGRKK